MSDEPAPIAPEALPEPVMAASEPPAAEQAPTAGQMIKAARTASGLHIGTLSMALKVPVKKLEALESDDWTQLPDKVFVRALATSVCRQIKTDSAPILAALPQTMGHRMLDGNEKSALNQPFHASTDAKFAWAKIPMSMPMMAGALVLLLAAVVLIFLPNLSKQSETSQVQVPTTLAPAPIFPPPVATVVPLPANVPAVLASAPVATPPAPQVLPTTNPILRMEAKGVVWVEVKDSKGALLIQRTLQPKEVASVSGQPPLAVVIGRINEIASVNVRGKPFSLDGMSPDNVARFEVK